MLRLIFAIVVGLALLSSPTYAQEPPPEPVGTLKLVETGHGAYQLEFQAVSDKSPYVVSFHTSRIGTDQGVAGELAEIPHPDFTIGVALPLDGMSQEGCYRVGFYVAPKEGDGTLKDFTGGASIETRGCVDAAGVVTFPAHDSVIAPPPPPPSDVRVVPRYDYWAIEWTDNSADEIAFEPKVIFFDRPWAEGGSQISMMTLPEVPANQTAAYALGTGAFFVPDQPAEPTCGYAMVLVFAIGPDSPSVWPGNTTIPACFGGGTLSFPETGHGADHVARSSVLIPLLVMAIGIAVLTSGFVGWRGRGQV